MKSVKYRSRISVFLTILIGIILIFSTLTAFKSGTLATAISSICPIFVLLCFMSTKYVILDEKLIVELMGIKMTAINIANIRLIERSYNPLSSPAISLKHLSLSFYLKGRKRSMLISPVREQEFIAQLKSVNPNIIVHVKDKTGILRFLDFDF